MSDDVRPITDSPSVAEVDRKLSEMELPPGFSGFSPAWDELLLMYKSSKRIGEIRAPADWNELPRPQEGQNAVWVRVVCLSEGDGRVLRWGDDRMHEALGGEWPQSDRFIRTGDDASSFKKGYIQVTAEGKILFRPNAQPTS